MVKLLNLLLPTFVLTSTYSRTIEDTEGVFINESKAFMLSDDSTVLLLDIAVKNKDALPSDFPKTFEDSPMANNLIQSIMQQFKMKNSEEERAFYVSLRSALKSLTGSLVSVDHVKNYEKVKASSKTEKPKSSN